MSDGGPGAAIRLALGAGAVALLVRGSSAFGDAVARDVGMPTPSTLDAFPLLLVALATGLLLRVRPRRIDRLAPFLAAVVGAAGGVWWAGSSPLEGIARVAGFTLVVATFGLSSAAGPTERRARRERADGEDVG